MYRAFWRCPGGLRTRRSRRGDSSAPSGAAVAVRGLVPRQSKSQGSREAAHPGRRLPGARVWDHTRTVRPHRTAGGAAQTPPTSRPRRSGELGREAWVVTCTDLKSPFIILCFVFQVRTKDHRFESVSHLISYHMDNRLPIVSAGSEVCLQQPVERRAWCEPHQSNPPADTNSPGKFTLMSLTQRHYTLHNTWIHHSKENQKKKRVNSFSAKSLVCCCRHMFFPEGQTVTPPTIRHVPPQRRRTAAISQTLTVIQGWALC